MREYNLLNEYPNSLNHRLVGDNLRTIEHRIISTYRDQNFLMVIEIMVMEDINMMVDGKNSR